jgi:hypothetical protein
MTGANIVRTWRLRSWWRSGVPQGLYADLVQDIDDAVAAHCQKWARLADAEAEEAMLAAAAAFPDDQEQHAAASVARRIAAVIRGKRDLAPWDDFLRARKRCIDHMTEQGHDAPMVAHLLSMNEQQVRAILAAHQGAR